MRKKDYLLYILKRSNYDRTMCSEYLSRLGFMEKVVNVCKKQKIYNKHGILAAKHETIKQHILDCLYGDHIICDKNTEILDLLEFIKMSGLKEQGEHAVGEYLDAFLEGDKDIGDLKKIADKSVKYVKDHVPDERVRKIYDCLGVFDYLKFYIMDSRVSTKDKDGSACIRVCRKKAREIEMQLCQTLWEPANALILQPIFQLPKIGNLLAYLAYTKKRYETPMEMAPDDLNFFYYEDEEFGWVAEYEDVAWKAVGDTREEAINNLHLTWKNTEEKSDFVWLEINKEYSEKLDYITLLRNRSEKVVGTDE